MYDAEQASASSDASETEDETDASLGESAGTGADEPTRFPPLIQESPDGPPSHRRNRRWRRVLAWTAGGLAILLILIAAGGYATYRYYNGRIKHVTIAVPASHPQPAAAPPGTENFLLVGVDSRAGTGNEYQSQYAVEGERSDTTILAHVDKDGTTTLLSFPRDMYVKIPSYTDKDGVKHAASMNKFNYAIQVGGASLLVDMVQQLTGIKIDHYVQVDLEGFKKMSNAIGGVQVCLKRSTYEYNNAGSISTNLSDGFSQFHGHVNENTLEGDNALAFVRQRYGLPNGDIDRIKRQQVFLSAVLRKALSTSVLLNPTKLVPLLNAATGALETDKGTQFNDLRKLADRLRGLDPSKVFLETVKTRNAELSDPDAFLDSSGNVEVGVAGSAQIWTPDDLQSLVGPLGGHVVGATSPSPSAPPSGASASAGASPSAGASTSPSAASSTSPSASSPSPGTSPSASPSAPPTPDTAADAGTCANPIY